MKASSDDLSAEEMLKQIFFRLAVPENLVYFKELGAQHEWTPSTWRHDDITLNMCDFGQSLSLVTFNYTFVKLMNGPVEFLAGDEDSLREIYDEVFGETTA